MRERFQLPLPMWTVQYQLLGGHLRMGMIAAIYVAVAVVGCIGVRRLMPRESLSTVASYLVNGAVVIQIALAILGGCNAVYRAMLRDYETKMLESHRLTPMSNIAVTLGYLWGPTLQIQSLLLVNVAIGAVLVALEGRPVSHWLYGNLVLFVAALNLWSATVFMGMRSGKPVSPAPALIGLALVTMWVIFLPGAGLLFGTYAIMLAFSVLTGNIADATPAILCVMIVSAALTGFWITAAAARYRRPDLPALNAVGGLVLLGIWLVAAVGGIAAYELTPPAFRSFYDSDFIEHQWVATLIASLVFGAIAVSGAVECEHLVRRGAAPRGWHDRVSSAATCLVAALLIIVLPAGIGWWVWAPSWASEAKPLALGSPWTLTLAATVLAMVTVRGVMAAIYPHVKAGKVIIGLLVLLAWGGPPAVDAVRSAYVAEYGENAALSFLTGCSPGGTIAAAWYDMDIPVLPGLLIQVVLAALCTFLAWNLTRLSRRTAAS